MERMTRENPGLAEGHYRCPINSGQEISIKNFHNNSCIFGSAIDLLGRYEDTGLTPREIMELKLLRVKK